LNIKFSQKKQELREDPVLDFFLKVKQYAVRNANGISVAALAVVVVGGSIFVYSQMRKSGRDKARDAFGQAMIELNNRHIEKAIEDFRIVADNQRNTPAGAESALMLGSIFFNMGRYDEAIPWFETAVARKGEPEFVAGEALEGLAGCYEAKGDIPRALDYLEKALRDERVRYRHAAIRWKMALLNQKIKGTERAKSLCREILSDTTAADYRQRAENLLAVLEAVSG
jgi:tetratricopeptide (TPR) repeat protein